MAIEFDGLFLILQQSAMYDQTILIPLVIIAAAAPNSRRFHVKIAVAIPHAAAQARKTAQATAPHITSHPAHYFAHTVTCVTAAAVQIRTAVFAPRGR
jgi:hypothetical protein